MILVSFLLLLIHCYSFSYPRAIDVTRIGIIPVSMSTDGTGPMRQESAGDAFDNLFGGIAAGQKDDGLHACLTELARPDRTRQEHVDGLKGMASGSG